jgi:hypothetical protein
MKAFMTLQQFRHLHVSMAVSKKMKHGHFLTHLGTLRDSSRLRVIYSQIPNHSEPIYFPVFADCITISIASICKPRFSYIYQSPINVQDTRAA